MFLSFVLAIYTWFFGGWTLSKDITLGTTAFSVLAILLFIFLWIVPNVMDNKKNLEKSENWSFLEWIFFINFCIFLLGLGSGIYSYLTDGYDALRENDYFWGSFLFFGIAIYISNVWNRQKQESLELKQLAEYLDSPQGRRERLISTLTDISGVSDNIARTILDQFPTFKSIEKASVTDLSKVPRVGKNLARAIKARINNLKNT